MYCGMCKKRLRLHEEVMGRCRCSGVFCPFHKEPAVHACAYDYKAEQKEKLSHELPHSADKMPDRL